jgi:Cdc6-like AAA superfamily ATPase
MLHELYLEGRRLLRTEVGNLVREAVNEQIEHATETVGYVKTTFAPALVELDTNETVPATALREVEDFIQSHETSALGLAGPRGVGKTTVIRKACETSDTRIGVHVPTSVAYATADFVRVLHGEVARAILEATGQHNDIRQRLRLLRLGRVMIGIVFANVGFLLVTGNFDWVADLLREPSKVLGAGLLAGGGVLYGWAMYSGLSTRRAARRERSVVGLAEAELTRLGWATQTQKGITAGLTPAKWLNLEHSSQITLSEREQSHPERVAAFNRFLRLYRNTPRAKTLVIGLDELDKLPSGEALIDVVNGLKDLFHTPGTHFVVSVSEDALHRFAARGVPVRDAFDSAFDTVIRCDRLRPGESVDLLKQRVVQFTEPVALFCHAWGGGLPRDVIRAARACVALRRRSDDQSPCTRWLPRSSGPTSRTSWPPQSGARETVKWTSPSNNWSACTTRWRTNAPTSWMPRSTTCRRHARTRVRMSATEIVVVPTPTQSVSATRSCPISWSPPPCTNTFAVREQGRCGRRRCDRARRHEPPSSSDERWPHSPCSRLRPSIVQPLPPMSSGSMC